MEGDDASMVDAEVLPTTVQVNGNGNHDATIDPTKISFLANPHDLLSPKLPIHGLGNSWKVPPASALYASNRASDSNEEIYSEIESDAMDTTHSTATAVQVRIPPPPRFPPLPYSSSKTGLVYDARMRFHAELYDYMSTPDEIHPEDPRRIHEIYEAIREAGLVQGPEDLEINAHEDQCWRIEIRHATEAEICLVHNATHFRYIESLAEKPETELETLSRKHDSIYFNYATFMCATLAAGGAIEACRAVVRGDVRNAIAIIRPPGHHAESYGPAGFCIFNNVPVATRVCQKDFPETCRKVLILDWDVHHGNGIQHMFYDDPNVLYISLHVFEGGTFYPAKQDGDYINCGEGDGLGRNINIPWDSTGMGDAEYIYAFQELVMPVAAEFDPDLVIISAGFDAAEGDLLGGCHVTPACYAHMTHMLMRVAEGKVVVCLEGGYNLQSIAKSALAVTKTLMLQPPERLVNDLQPQESAVRTIEQVKRQHSNYWKCLYPKQLERSAPSFHATRRLHEIIREWQSQSLSEEFSMTPLVINKAGIAQTFEHNVLATGRFMERHPLLVVFHDPPSVKVEPDFINGKPEFHNMWLTDVTTKDYIGWVIENGFQVIDVNIPKVVSIKDDDGRYISTAEDEKRADQTRELATYIWENYIEPHEATQVFFLGIGAAYIGLVNLLGTHESCTEEDSIVQSLIGFVGDSSIQSIIRPTDDNISSWYYANSLIFVQHDHSVWDPKRQRKPRKKWGRLFRSPKDNLDDMLSYHLPEIQEHLLQKRNEKEEQERETGFANSQQSPQQGLRSPPLPSQSSEARQGSMPPLGLFTVGTKSPRLSSVTSPRSPGSPLKDEFRRS